MGSVGTPIIGRPRPSPRHRRTQPPTPVSAKSQHTHQPSALGAGRLEHKSRPRAARERDLRVTAHFVCWNRHAHQEKRASSHENALLKPGTYDAAPDRR